VKLRFVVFALFLIFVPNLFAQRQTFSGTSICGLSQVHQTVAPDDGGQHSLSLDQRVCTWQKPSMLGGVAFVDYTAYGTDDVQFGRSVDRGYSIGRNAGSDKFYLKYEGTSIMNGPVPVKLQGTWQFTGGEGRLTGLRGEGTYTAHPTPAGEMIFEISGTYEIAPGT